MLFLLYHFSVLRAMLHEWVRDVAKYRNKLADELITNFYRFVAASFFFLLRSFTEYGVNSDYLKLSAV